MSDVFLSYKREDQERVLRLVKALEGAGLSVWWDRHLPGGEDWRSKLREALDAAPCVIVVWSQNSVGPEGDFVRDEASDAKERGALVPVLFDRVRQPLGFGEIQALDLTRWRGKESDPFFQDVLAAVRAKIEGHPAPAPKGPTARLMRRLRYGALGSAASFILLAFADNLFGLQDRTCEFPLAQPGLSDVCGALGLGSRPSQAERLAWEARSPGSCDALRAHVERFPNGAFRDDAADMLSARRVGREELWEPGERVLALFQSQDGEAAPDESAARGAALARARRPAERLCQGFAATTTFRFNSAEPRALEWHCGPVRGGVICGFQGEVVCSLDERRVVERETCGSTK